MVGPVPAVVRRNDEIGPVSETRVAVDQIEYAPEETVDLLDGIEIIRALPTVGMAGRVRIGEMDEGVTVRRRGHARHEAVDEGRGVSLVHVPVDLVPAVIDARRIRGSVRRVPAPIEERELALARVHAGRKAAVVRDVEYAGDIGAVNGLERAAVVAVETDAMSVRPENRTARELAGVIRQRDGIVIVVASVVGESAFDPEAIEMRQRAGPDHRDHVSAKPVDAHVNHVRSRGPRAGKRTGRKDREEPQSRNPMKDAS